MNQNKVRLLNSILVLLLTLMVIIAVSYSWSDQRYLYNKSVVGKSEVAPIIYRYFAGGEGTESDPYTITEPQHFFNLAYLQGLGHFDSQKYYFSLENDIDFNGVPSQYQSMPPIGIESHPFIGEFEGNFYTISNYNVDGTWYDGTELQKLQDIGTFGYIGINGVVQNFFLENMTIITDGVAGSLTGYHTHNDGTTNFAIGYAAGHIADGGYIDNVFVINPTMDSASVTIESRTQYGLIGYNAADLGNFAGAPEDVAYNFTLDADSLYPAVSSAVGTYGTELVNNHAVDTVADVLELSSSPSKRLVIGGTTNGFDTNYTFSTIQIWSDAYNKWVFLYDQMVEDGNPIGDETNGYYSRQNIDLIGDMTFVSNASLPGYTYTFAIADNSSSYVTPTVGTTFDRTQYPQSLMIFAQPTNDLNDLGYISAVYTSTGDMTYNTGTTAGQTTSAVNFSDSGVEATLIAANALCAVTYDSNTNVMTVVDSNPDFYVFCLGVSNGIVKIGQINFHYTPQAVDKAALSSIGTIDYITVDDMNAIKAEWLATQTVSHYFSYLNFGYEVIPGQSLAVNTHKTDDGNDWDIPNEYTFTISNVDTNSGVITIYILNLPNDNDLNNEIIIVYGTTTLGPYTTDIVEVSFDATNQISVDAQDLT